MAIDVRTLMARVLELTINPRQTWEQINQEKTPGPDLIFRYVFPLALIPSVALFLGNLIFGLGFFRSLTYSLFLVGIFIGSVFLLAILSEAMAAPFGSERNREACFRLAAYVSTPVWVCGFMTLIPSLTPLAMLIGFGYSAYLFFLGCPILLQTPKDKAIPFAATAVLCWMAVVSVVSLFFSQLVMLMFATQGMFDTLPRPGPSPFGS